MSRPTHDTNDSPRLMTGATGESDLSIVRGSGGRGVLSAPKTPEALWRVAHTALLVSGASLFVLWNSRMKWYGDDWDFLTPPRSVSEHPLAALLSDHNGHWVMLPVLVFRGTLELFGMSSYLPFAVPNIAAHLLVVHLLRGRLLRLGAPAAVATLLPASVLFLAAAYTNLLWGFPINLVGSIALGLAAAAVIDPVSGRGKPPSGVRIGVAATLLLASVASSGTGIGMVVAVGILTGLHGGWLRFAAVVAPAGLAFSAWFLTYGDDAARLCPVGATGPGGYLVFLGAALEKSLSGLGAIPLSAVVVAPVAAAGIIVSLARVVPVSKLSFRRSPEVPDRMPPPGLSWVVASAFGCAAVYLTVASSRACLGMAGARAPRYAYFAAVLLAPAVGVGITTLVRASPTVRQRTTGIVVTAVLAGVVGVNALHMSVLAGCRAERVNHAWEQVALVPIRPSSANPQVTPALLTLLESRYELVLPAPDPNVTEAVVGC